MEYRLVDTLKQELEARSIEPAKPAAAVSVPKPPVKDDLGLGDPGDCKVCQELQDEFRKNPGGSPPKKLGLIVAAGVGTVAVAISAVCIPFVAPALRRYCLPYVPATDTQVSNVLKALSNRSGTVLDIGSGDGRIVMAVAKQGFSATGVELNRWLVYYSRYKARMAGLSRMTGFYRADLWKHNLNKYDNIVIFGVEQMMADLEKKMISEVKPDSLVVACRFKFPGLKPIKEIGSGVDTVWTYKIPS
eukprot:TRINITY_DN7220_c0_g1_i10.p1 TRINITY_DN7220_c0_g1~~TRINITY_DN7220_c0_g1_i10.p1  ORF type:complete len:246 (+),score=44.12 TRINITY_DN7220_c0_g1_i10:44-781(+)